MTPTTCVFCRESEGMHIHSRYGLKRKRLTRLRLACRKCATSLAKKWRTKNPKRMAEIVRRSVRKHRERQMARMAVASAVRKGILFRPFFCPRCEGSAEVHAHHEDYSRPLEVQWMCRSCHSKADRIRRRVDNSLAIASHAGTMKE